MSRTADNLYEFSNDIFMSIGFGNDNMAKAFCVGAVISILAIAGFYFPPLGIAMHWILPLLIGGATFGGAALMTNFEPMGVLTGLVLGFVTGGISYAFCASVMYVAPAATTLIASPNLVAGGSYLGGGFFSCVDGVWTGLKSCCSALAKCFCCCFSDGGPTEVKAPLKGTNNAGMHYAISGNKGSGQALYGSSTTTSNNSSSSPHVSPEAATQNAQLDFIFGREFSSLWSGTYIQLPPPRPPTSTTQRSTPSGQSHRN